LFRGGTDGPSSGGVSSPYVKPASRDEGTMADLGRNQIVKKKEG